MNRRILGSSIAGALLLFLTIETMASASLEPQSEVARVRFEDQGVERPLLDSLQSVATAEGTTLWEAIEAFTASADAPMRESACSEPSSRESLLDPDRPCDPLLAYPKAVEIDGLGIDELVDLRQLAKGKGMPLRQAIDRYGWQMSFIEAITMIRQNYEDEYAGSAIVDGGLGAWIAFKEQIPADALQLVKGMPVPVKLIGGRGYSEAELKRAIDSSSQHLFGRPDVLEGTGSYDQDTGVITLSVRLVDSHLSDVELSAWISSLSLPRPENARITINVRVVERQLTERTQLTFQPCKYQVSEDVCVPGADYDPDDKMRGGGDFQDAGTGGPCTAGFTVRKTGFKGNSSAGHCVDSSSTTQAFYLNHITEDASRTEVDVEGSHEGTHGDVAYYDRGSFTVLPTFYYDTGKTRSAESVWTPVTGANVCKFGRTTGFTCDEVYSLNNTASFPDGTTVGSLVATLNHILEGGDSGGPWFWGTKAFGLSCCYGSVSFPGIYIRDLFSPANKLNNALGVSVYTE